MLWAEVRVPHHHSQGRVPKQVLEFRQGRPALDRPGREGVAQVVEVQPIQLGGLQGPLPALTEHRPRRGPEHRARATSGLQAGQGSVGRAAEGHLPATAGLGPLEK